MNEHKKAVHRQSGTAGANANTNKQRYEVVGVDRSFPALQLTANGLREHVKDLALPTTQISHTDVLDTLIEHIEHVDFKEIVTSGLREQAERLRSQAYNEDGTTKDEEKVGEHQEILGRINMCKVTNAQRVEVSVTLTIERAKGCGWELGFKNGAPYVFNGAYWKTIESEVLTEFLHKVAVKMGVNEHIANYHKFRSDLFAQFTSTAFIETLEKNDDAVRINLNDGTYEISATGRRLLPFDSSDFFTYQLPYCVDLTATAPKFQAFLDRVLPVSEMQLALAEYLGYCLTRNQLKLEKVLILFGNGANGKSVIQEIVRALLGRENVSSHSLQELTDSKGYHRAMIGSKMVNYATEIGGKTDADILKTMASGEPLSVRLPYGKPHIITSYAKLIFNANELPRDVEHTGGYFRRFLVIPFCVSIPYSEQDSSLHTKIIDAEIQGVFTWVLEGLDRLRKQKKFTTCKSMEDVLTEYRTDANSVLSFVQDGHYVKSQHTTALCPLYTSYTTYCKDNGQYAMTSKRFSKELEKAGFEKTRISRGVAFNIEVEGGSNAHFQ